MGKPAGRKKRNMFKENAQENFITVNEMKHL